MIPADLASSLFDEMSDRLVRSVKATRELCAVRGCELTREQEFILTSLPLYALLGFTETAERMVETYTAIRNVLVDVPEWTDGAEAWLEAMPVSERRH